MSHSSSSRSSSHHLKKQTLVVEPGTDVVHDSSAAVVHNEASPPLEHRHHHSHHRNHDVHEGIVRVPVPEVVVTHSEPAVQSSPLVVHEKVSTHRLSKTYTQPETKTVEHQVIRVQEPVKTVTHHQVSKVHAPIQTVTHHQTKVYEPVKTVTHHLTELPVKTVQNHHIKIQETVKSPVVKQSLVQSAHKSYLSPSELFRTRSVHQDQVVRTHTEEAKQRYVPNFKPASSTYSRCYCV